ncbi:MAG: hydroxyacid dehydrogenase [Thermoplasmatota archaeon]
MRVLVTDPLAPAAVERLRAQHEVVVQKMDPDALLREIGSFEALLVRSETKVTRKVIEAAGRLKIIGRAGVGVDNIDVAAAKERGIIVVNAPDASTNAVAELALGHMLSHARHLPEADAALKAGKWEKKALQGTELAGKTLGLVGMGRIGTRLVGFAKALDMKVLVYDPYVSAERAREIGVEKTEDVLDVAQRGDYISVHTPLTPETKGIVGEKFLRSMKKTACVINCARGGIIDEPALLKALAEGWIGGAALDVFETEPPMGNPIMGAPKLHMTPHLGASTDEAQDRAGLSVAEAVITYGIGGKVPNRVV